MSGPAAEYRRRLDARRQEHARLDALDATHGWIRLVVFIVAAVTGILVYRDLVGAWWLTLPSAVFLGLVARHDGVIRAKVAASRAVAFYEHGLARLEDRWVGFGSSGERFRDDTHPYANDLDLFGRGSLFELLSIARTRFGEDMLAAWLSAPASVDELRARHEAVAELAPALDLREAVAVAGATVGAGVDGAALVTWAEAPSGLRPPALRVVAIGITVALTASLVVWGTTGNSTWFMVMLLAQILFSAPLRAAVDRALHAATAPARDLDILVGLLARLEGQAFTAGRLVTLRDGLRLERVPASRTVGSLHRLVEMHDWQHNPLFAPVAAVFMWGTHLAWAIDAWRRVNGRHIGVWLRTVGEFEALASLAAYHFEHPADPFPTVEPSTPACRVLLDGDELGHPLIAAARMVPNSVRLDVARQLLIVSGSNMSGKSTFLRTVGVGVVMALAGCPVRARGLRLTPLAIGATLRIQDSLQEGRSRFYAEITRIRDIAARAEGPLPLLFLLDELFHGTNSHDRLVGAAGVLRSLLDHGAVGLITTHDLALTAVADRLAPRAMNVHFEDWFDGDELRFDYRMKPGPVSRSNAVALMRAVGLDVTSDEP